MTQNKPCLTTLFWRTAFKRTKTLPKSQGDSLLIPVSLEIAGSLNHYTLSFHALSSNVIKLQVKADFEKLAQGRRLLRVHTEEAWEIERSYFREINKAVTSPSEP